MARDKEVRNGITKASEFAIASPMPDRATVADYVFA